MNCFRTLITNKFIELFAQRKNNTTEFTATNQIDPKE